MKSLRVWLTVLLCGVLWISVSSCFNASPAYISTSKTRNIHLIVKMNKGDYWNTLKLGAEAAAKEFNVNLTFKAPDSESDIEEQVVMVEESIKEKADVIILAASSYMGLAQVVDQAAYSRIPVISVDAEVGSAKVRTYVGSNGYEAGQKSAERLIELLGAMERSESLISPIRRLPRTPARLAVSTMVRGMQMSGKRVFELCRALP